MSHHLEVARGRNGERLARRKDGQPMTAEGWAEVDRLPGITVADVLRVFPGSKVVPGKEAGLF